MLQKQRDWDRVLAVWGAAYVPSTTDSQLVQPGGDVLTLCAPYTSKGGSRHAWARGASARTHASGNDECLALEHISRTGLTPSCALAKPAKARAPPVSRQGEFAGQMRMLPPSEGELLTREDNVVPSMKPTALTTALWGAVCTQESAAGAQAGAGQLLRKGKAQTADSHVQC